jgi:hypothetical protein
MVLTLRNIKLRKYYLELHYKVWAKSPRKPFVRQKQQNPNRDAMFELNPGTFTVVSVSLPLRFISSLL